MSDYGFGDYYAYRMKMKAISFVIVFFGAMLFFGGKAIYEAVYSFMVSITSIEWVIYGASVSATVWAIVCFLWAAYLIYKDGKV